MVKCSKTSDIIGFQQAINCTGPCECTDAQIAALHSYTRADVIPFFQRPRTISHSFKELCCYYSLFTADRGDYLRLFDIWEATHYA